MSRGSDALSDVHRKLDWATGKHDEMLRVFEDYLKPGGGDERPCGIRWRELDKPKGLVIARFMIEEPMPDKMTMLAADLVHNTRSGLDHVLARLKEHLGGDPGQGSFPTRQREDLWQNHVIKPGKKGPLHGLPQDAVDLIYNEQPLHQAVPAEDPLVILNGLDNTFGPPGWTSNTARCSRATVTLPRSRTSIRSTPRVTPAYTNAGFSSSCLSVPSPGRAGLRRRPKPRRRRRLTRQPHAEAQARLARMTLLSRMDTARQRLAPAFPRMQERHEPRSHVRRARAGRRT